MNRRHSLSKKNFLYCLILPFIATINSTSLAKEFATEKCYAQTVAMPPGFQRLSDFPLDYSWGFIDHSGKLVIEANYAFADDFNNGYAVVSDSNVNGYNFFFIDKYGKKWKDKNYRYIKGTPYSTCILSQDASFPENLWDGDNPPHPPTNFTYKLYSPSRDLCMSQGFRMITYDQSGNFLCSPQDAKAVNLDKDGKELKPRRDYYPSEGLVIVCREFRDSSLDFWIFR